MVHCNRFAGLGIAAALAMVSAGASADPLTPNPQGTWTGTVKCEAKVQDATSSKFKVTNEVTARIGDPFAAVCGRFGSAAPIVVPYIGAYIPESPGATKGTLGFATGPAVFEAFPFPPAFLPYFETAQAKLEGKKDGSVVIKGKSIVLADSPDGAVTATCEWNLDKLSDDQYAPTTIPFPPCLPEV